MILQFIRIICKSMMNNEYKLVQALQSFMERSVLPCLPEEHSTANQWKFLSGMMGARPIDYSQLDFYLLMANKSSPGKQPSLIKQARSCGETDSPLRGRRPVPKMQFKQTSKRRDLLQKMSGLHQTMMRNQQKLQSFNKKDSNTSTQLNSSVTTTATTYSAGNARRY